MIYVISDVHGYKQKFDQMLDLINFSEEDQLFFLGDAIDRGPDGIALLQKMMRMPNVTALLGNHEHMMAECIAQMDPSKTNRWIKNGGQKTMDDYFTLSAMEQQEILDWIGQLPSYMEINVNGQEYYLVHGWPGKNIYDEIWGRPKDLTEESSLVTAPTQIIIGHSPVPIIACKTSQEQEVYFRKLEQTGGHIQILRTSTFIDIDCGCGHRNVPGTRLACLRLEDQKEFYL